MAGFGVALRARASGSARFLRFCAVGGLGFCVDAAALLAAIHLLGAEPIPARLMAAAAAILTTFECNRRWAFRDAAAERYWPALCTYLGVQALGLACNVSVFAACTFALPAPLNAPILCLVAASAAALLVNYAGASRVVFRARAG